MGHTRLGSIPKTRNWEKVVNLLASPNLDLGIAPSQVPTIASYALIAAEEGINKAKNDEGLVRSLYLLIATLQAVRSSNPIKELESIGINLNENSTIFDTVSKFQDLLDKVNADYGSRTDIGEIAQQAAGETLSAILEPLHNSLFKSGIQDILLTLRKASTKAGFSKVGRTFFSYFLKRFLNFYLSRASASLISSPAFAHVGIISDFDRALQLHCYQSARIVEVFSGSWYSKATFEQGINLSNTKRFIAVALKKLADEIAVQGGQ